MKGFMNFVREHGVVGMTVGLAIGLQATVTVQDIVAGFVDPIVGWALGIFMDNPEGLRSLEWTVFSGDNPLVISWGMMLSSIIALLAVMFVIYFFIKKMGLDKLDKKTD